jgi:glycosyltransferase involved in cell wall biosynthesis
MKALVIAPQPFFTPRGTPFSVYYRTMITAELGVDIDLLTYGEGQDVDIPNVNIIRIPRFGFLGNVKTGPSALKLFLDVFILFRTIRLLLFNKYDVVHAHEEAIFFCRFLKPMFGFKLIYDMHSSLPQQLTNFEFTTSKFLIGLFEKLENTSIEHAEAVITICPDLADYVESLIGKHEKHFLIENSIFDEVKLAAGSPDAVSNDVGESEALIPDGHPLIVYAGTLEAYQGIDLLIPGFAKLLDTHPGARLLIAGGTPEQVEDFQAMINRLGIGDSCRMTGRVPQPVAKRFNAAADIIVSPRKSGTNTPLKVYEQLQCGIPLVATDIYSHTQVLDDKVAFMVEPSADGIANGLREVIESPDEAARRVDNARQLYESDYSRAAYIDKMTRLLELVRR